MASKRLVGRGEGMEPLLKPIKRNKWRVMFGTKYYQMKRYWNLDLQIKNETNFTFQLILTVSDTHLVGEWRSEIPSTRKYEVYEKEHWMTLEYWGGYARHNTIHRRVNNLDEELIADEFVTENHAIMMYKPFLENNSA